MVFTNLKEKETYEITQNYHPLCYYISGNSVHTPYEWEKSLFVKFDEKQKDLLKEYFKKETKIDTELILKLEEHFSNTLGFNINIVLEQDDIFENSLKCYINYPKDKSIEDYISTWKKLIESSNEFLSKNSNLDLKKINVILK